MGKKIRSKVVRPDVKQNDKAEENSVSKITKKRKVSLNEVMESSSPKTTECKKLQRGCNTADNRRILLSKELEMQNNNAVPGCSYVEKTIQPIRSSSTNELKQQHDSEGEMDNEIDVEVEGIKVAVTASEDEFDYDSEFETEQSDKSDDESRRELIGSNRDTSINSEVQFRRSTGENHETVRKDLDVNSEEEAMQLLARNPHIKNLFKRMIRKEIQEEKEVTKNNRGKTGMENLNEETKQSTPKKMGRENQERSNLIKSPSDTTLYTPALKKLNPGMGDNDLIERISNFVEGIRMETTTDRKGSTRPNQDRNDIEPTEQGFMEEQQSEADKTKHFIVEAEQFKASVEPPKGKEELEILFRKYQEKLEAESDNEFFHLTCHIDAALKGKIECGEFVDLERLLPKCRTSLSEERQLEWVSHEGMTYLVPVQDKEQKINIKRWDQAFRIYAAIYCKANPSRAGEVWQYIYVIHSVASTYQWKNVAYYDYTFRQLMAEKPSRSWGKTYIQMWQLALRDPINKSQSQW